MMVIEGADRFGLAQLHQLRGRVGRGTAESFCVLVSDTTDETAQARLKAVTEIRDGFELAEKDFELRREGDVLGLAQSGPAAAPGRVAPEPRARRAREAGPRPRRGAARRRRPALPGGGAAPPRARAGLAGARLGRRPGQRRLADDGRRRPGDRGHPRRASGSGRPDPGRGRSPIASSRRSSRSSSRSSTAPASSTCSPAAAPAASRRCRAARRPRRSSRRTRVPPRSSTRTSARPASPATEAVVVRADALRWLDGGTVRRRRSTSSSSTRRTPRPELLAPRPRDPRRARRAARRRCRASSRSTSGATGRPSGSVCWPTERERRFGETALTFYRRAEAPSPR